MAAPEPQPLQFAPVPVSTAIAVVQTPQDGGRVLITFHTPQGVQGYFLSAEHARELVQQLDAAATGAATGLIIANGQVPREGD